MTYMIVKSDVDNGVDNVEKVTRDSGKYDTSVTKVYKKTCVILAIISKKAIGSRRKVSYIENTVIIWWEIVWETF